MGGRGAKSGVGGPAAQPAPTPKPTPAPAPKKSTVDQLNDDYEKNRGNINSLPPFGSTANETLGAVRGVYQPGYAGGGNAAVDKWQRQDATKSAAFLAKVHNETDYNQYPDKYGFYEGDYQKFSLAMGLNKPPTVLSEKEFNAVVKKNNLQVLYRGEAGERQTDRFMNAKYSHTGVGNFGDGFYFSQNKGDANSYAQNKGGIDGRVMKMALSPTARVITYRDLMKKWDALPQRMKNALTKQGESARAASGYGNKGQAQLALKLGYNVVSDVGRYSNSSYHYALTRDAFIVCETIKHRW